MIYRFQPLLKHTLWGGNRIIRFKHLDTTADGVGESWEISGVHGNETIVQGGPDDGKPLNLLVAEQQAALVGHDNYARFGNEFPLLIKFIDAHRDLSVQVHPDDATARRLGFERGKNEMWYVLPSEDDAQLLNGLNRAITPDEYRRRVADDTITDVLARHSAREGDAFFIPAGRIHAIGAGCFVAEIQQTSDVTFRIYDYKRRDSHGQLRQLHIEQAAQAIDFTVDHDYRVAYTPQLNQPVQLVSTPWFTTAVYDLTEPMLLDYSDLDSFVVLIGVKGQGTVSAGADTVKLQAGQTILLPATTGQVSVEGTLRFLEAFV